MSASSHPAMLDTRFRGYDSDPACINLSCSSDPV